MAARERKRGREREICRRCFENDEITMEGRYGKTEEEHIWRCMRVTCGVRAAAVAVRGSCLFLGFIELSEYLHLQCLVS